MATNPQGVNSVREVWAFYEESGNDEAKTRITFKPYGATSNPGYAFSLWEVEFEAKQRRAREALELRAVEAAEAAANAARTAARWAAIAALLAVVVAGIGVFKDFYRDAQTEQAAR